MFWSKTKEIEPLELTQEIRDYFVERDKGRYQDKMDMVQGYIDYKGYPLKVTMETSVGSRFPPFPTEIEPVDPRIRDWEGQSHMHISLGDIVVFSHGFDFAIAAMCVTIHSWMISEYGQFLLSKQEENSASE